MRVEYKVLMFMIAFFAIAITFWMFQISVVNVLPILLFMVCAIGLIYILQRFGGKSHTSIMSPFEALRYVMEEWEDNFHERVTPVDSIVSPFYIPGNPKLFYSMRIQRPEGNMGNRVVPVVLNVSDKHVYWELYPTPDQIDHPYRIIVPEGINVSPVEKLSPEAMTGYWNRRGGGEPRQVFNIHEKGREKDDLDKLRGTNPEDEKDGKK